MSSPSPVPLSTSSSTNSITNTNSNANKNVNEALLDNLNTKVSSIKVELEKAEGKLEKAEGKLEKAEGELKENPNDKTLKENVEEYRKSVTSILTECTEYRNEIQSIKSELKSLLSPPSYASIDIFTGTTVTNATLLEEFKQLRVEVKNRSNPLVSPSYSGAFVQRIGENYNEFSPSNLGLPSIDAMKEEEKKSPLPSPLIEHTQKDWKKRKEKPGEDKHHHAFFHHSIPLLFPTATEKKLDKLPRANQLNDFVLPFGGSNLILSHCIHSKYLYGLSPDFSLFHPNYSKEFPFGCILNIELTASTPLSSDKEHLGKALIYNEHILSHQPHRFHAFTLVSNMLDVIVVKTTKRYFTTFDSQMTGPLPLLDSGWLYIRCLLQDPSLCGYWFPSVNHNGHSLKIQNYLGSGVSSHVYEATDNNDSRLIVKIFRQIERQHREIEILTEMESRIKSGEVKSTDIGSRFCRYLSHSTTTSSLSSMSAYHSIVMCPPGTPCKGDISKGEIAEIFDCMEALVAVGLVHRDLTYRHFLRRSTSPHRIFLIDFGYSIFFQQGQLSGFLGSSHFAPTSLLRELNDNENILYQPEYWHDWESVVKCILCRIHPDLSMKVKDLKANDFDGIYSLWTEIETSEAWRTSLWSSAMEIVRNATMVSNGDLTPLKKVKQIMITLCYN